jgi:4-hydroxyphenylpyruvate dioxygenase
MERTADYVKTDGLSFVEFSGNKPYLLTSLFEKMGFYKAGEMQTNPATLYRQGNINFISNPNNGGNTERFRAVHGRGASAMGFKVDDSLSAYRKAIALGAIPAAITDYDIPAIRGIGESLIYLVDAEKEKELFSVFDIDNSHHSLSLTHLQEVDHLTHNLARGTMQKWIEFYEQIFGFIKVRHFEIEGKKTGLYSEVVASRCGKLKIPLNESKDDSSQIEEFLKEYGGDGIQHIALSSSDIYSTVAKIKANGIPFQQTPDTYYELIDQRLPHHNENIEKLRQLNILIDGGPAQGGGNLLQIFTQNSIGPIFFEFIQRKGNEGFGEGNFQALFESIELDQIKRGVL